MLFKDICKTVVQKHQMNQCVRLARGNSAKQVIVQRVEVSILNELPERDLILSSLEGIQRHDDVAHAVSVEVGGTTYRKGGAENDGHEIAGHEIDGPSCRA